MDEKIEPDLVINKDNLELITCEICKRILNNHLQCSICKKSFCKKCLENYWKKNQENICTNNCHNPSFKPSNDLKDILEKLKFKCKNECNEEIPYMQLEDHYKNKCSKKVIDYKTEYLEYKNKYEDLLKKYEELKNNIKMTQDEHIADQNINDDNKDNDDNESIETTFKSIYHDHILKYKPFYYDIWTCDICLQSFDKKTKTGYNCFECDFDICSKCRIIEKSGYKFLDIFNSKKHKHLLRENKIEAYYKCDECENTYRGARKTFRCKECSFDLCIECIKKENSEYLSS